MHEIVDMALGVGNLPEQIWSIIKRAEAAEAEVKRLKQMSLGSIYKEATDRLETAEARVRELERKIEVQEMTAAKVAAQAQEIATAHKMMDRDKEEMMDRDKEDYDELKERFDTQAQEIERLRVHLAGLESEAHSDYQELESELGGMTQRAESAEARVLDLTKALTDALARCNQHIDDAAIERTLRLSLEGERNAAEARVRELELQLASEVRLVDQTSKPRRSGG